MHYTAFEAVITKLEHSYNLHNFHIVSICLESKAFSKLKKLMKSDLWNSLHRSKMFFRIDIWSRQLWPFLKCACSLLNFPAIRSWICSKIHLAKSFDMIFSRVIPLQLLHKLKSPSLANLLMMTQNQSSSTSFSLQISKRNDSWLLQSHLALS